MSLNQLFEQLIGGQSGATAQGAEQQQGGQPQSNSHSPNGMPDIMNKIPGGLGGMAGGLAAGGLLGVLVGNKKARKTAGKMAGGAVALGGTALLGAVAFKAYKNWQSGGQGGDNGNKQQALPDPAAQEYAKFDPVVAKTNDGETLQLTLIKSMIAAANADGHIDATEQAAIFDAVNKMELEASDKALVFDTLQSPPDIATIASLANGLEQATEIYLVSRMAIDPDHPSEKAYLADLAEKMSMPQELVMHLETQVSEQMVM